MRKLLSAFLLTLGVILFFAASKAQSVTPAELGITPLTSPEVLDVLDNTKTWVPLGSVDSSSHSFHSFSGEADILVTDPSIGMVAGGQDNAPFIQALMNKMGTPPTAGGYDITFPSIPGQNYTEYYFSKPLLLSRSANYHCAGPPNSVGSSVVLVFAPGAHGVIQEDGHYTPDGGYGGGVVDGCWITNLGFATGTANPSTATTLTNASFRTDPQHIIPASTWNVGDGIVVLPQLAGFFPDSAVLTVPPGTSVIGVSGSTLTLSNPVAQSLGVTPFATATFTQTASNNFVNNDTITVGNSTYKFVSILGSTPNNVKIGTNFAASAANLIAAIKSSVGQMQIYVPQQRSTAAVYPQVTAAYASGVITFTTLWGGPDANTYPSTYAAAGTAAGSFGGSTFSGATASNQAVVLYQLPSSQTFTIQTTIGSNSVLVTGGPRLLVPGELVWSDAFPFGTVVGIVSGTLGSQTAVFDNAYITGPANATVTHTSGSPGHLWVLPAGIKRDVQAKSSNNYITNFPIGLEMACNSNFPFNCTASRDEGNWILSTMVGRWISGNNTSASGAINEAFARNFIMDIFEGGSLGSVYFNLNTNSFEEGASKYSFLVNCVNQNDSAIFGGYLTTAPNSCANSTTLFPPYPGGPTTFIPQAGHSNGTTYTPMQIMAPGGLLVLSGNDGSMCLGFGGVPAINTTLFSFGLNNCGTTTTWGMGWNNTLNSFDLYPAFSLGDVVLRFISTEASFNGGYAGNGGRGTAIELPSGVLLNNPENPDVANTTSRYLAMGSSAPTGGYHLHGDIQVNTNAVPGGSLGWYDAADGLNFYPFGLISNNSSFGDYTIPVMRSGSSANKDLTGRITLSSGTATYTLAGTYATAPVCLTADATTPANASSVSESTTVLTFTGTGSDVIKYICAGRN